MKLPLSRTLSLRGSDVPYYSFPLFDGVPFIRNGFSTRLGGVSEGLYQSMNLDFNRHDTYEHVRENFRLFCRAVGVSDRDVVIAAQTHHDGILRVTADDRGKGIDRPCDYADIDGLMTDEPDVVLCAQCADCVVLFYADPVKRAVAVSHSGWRGTVCGMAGKTVRRMQKEFGSDPSDILVGIGPSIGPCCFETEGPVAERFLSFPFAKSVIRDAGHGKFFIDLWETNRQILLESGIKPGHIAVTDLCTCCHSDVFWSHRAVGPGRGNLAALIAIKREL